MKKMIGYGRKVHRSLLQRELVAGVPEIGLFLILMLGLVFVFGMELYFMIVPIVILYVIMRVLTKRDPYMIDIVIDNIFQKDLFYP
jgi:type IV secretory pathway VirB3-like protein